MKMYVQAAISSVIGLAVLALVLFLPAGTFNYWQAWVFMAVFTIATIVPAAYLARNDPAALRRRMHGGPLAEGRALQKVIITLAFLSLFAMTIVSALDRRYHWSSVPAAVSVIGDVLVAAGLGLGMLVVAQNRYAAATVTIEADQTVATGGLYKLVRHPMYAANVVLMIGIPLALGSYWGLVVLVPGVLVLVLRIFDEEQLLTQELDGYREYAKRVRYRLVPYLW